MIILPAIDLIDGHCVRLDQGVYEDKTVYLEDPLDMARSIEGAGAGWLHIIDLDRAMSKGSNEDVVAKILKSVDIPVQLGGGIRDEKTLEAVLELGVSRAILGTQAIKDPAWALEMHKKYGDKICLSLDAKERELKISGWQEGGGRDIFDYLDEVKEVSTIIYTDISRDGTLQGPNFDMLGQLRAAYDGFLIAAGGIQGREDFFALQDLGIDGVVVGKALYEGRISLEDIGSWGLR